MDLQVRLRQSGRTPAARVRSTFRAFRTRRRWPWRELFLPSPGCNLKPRPSLCPRPVISEPPCPQPQMWSVVSCRAVVSGSSSHFKGFLSAAGAFYINSRKGHRRAA